jgi:hypothetical protein
MVVGGIVPLPDSVQAVGLVIAGLLVAGGAAAAWLIFVRPAQSAALRQNLAAAGALTEDGYHFETGYSELHERGALPVGWLAGWIDLRVLQAVADAVGDAFDEAGALARRLEGDSLRDQLAVGGAALVIVLVVFAALHTGVAPISVGGK